MPHRDGPRMSQEEYSYYLDWAAKATAAAEVQHLRARLLRRWPGDPRTEHLADALYAHQERLAAREHARRLEAGRIGSHIESRIVRRTS